MAQSQNDRILTIVIVVLSVAGLLYFGLSAIQENRQKSSGNPFEYNIENYEKSGTDLVSYEEVAVLPLQTESPHAISVDAKDRIYISSQNKILILDENGTTLSTGSCRESINAITVDADGMIYVAFDNAVEIFDSTFTSVGYWEVAGTQSLLTSIAVAATDVYLADAGDRVVRRFDRDGHLKNTIGKKDESRDVPGFVIPSPYFDVVIDADGFLWAVNTGRHQFENYFPDGTLRSFWQKSSMAIDGFSGCCNPVHVALLADGSFVTSEKGILRIKIHNRIGEMTAVVALPDQFDEKTVALDIAVNSKNQILVVDPVRKQVRVFDKKKEIS